MASVTPSPGCPVARRSWGTDLPNPRPVTGLALVRGQWCFPGPWSQGGQALVGAAQHRRAQLVLWNDVGVEGFAGDTSLLDGGSRHTHAGEGDDGYDAPGGPRPLNTMLYRIRYRIEYILVSSGVRTSSLRGDDVLLPSRSRSVVLSEGQDRCGTVAGPAGLAWCRSSYSAR